MRKDRLGSPMTGLKAGESLITVSNLQESVHGVVISDASIEISVFIECGSTERRIENKQVYIQICTAS